MKDKLYQILKDILRTNAQPQEITAENTSEWDSLTHLNLVLALEEEFEINIAPAEISQLYSDYDTILTFIRTKNGQE